MSDFCFGVIIGVLGTLGVSSFICLVAVRGHDRYDDGDENTEREIFRSVEHPRRVSFTSHALPH